MQKSTAGGGADRASVIAAVLQANIVSGHYAIGERLPSEADLCAHFTVSRPTLREALGRLSAQGLIVSRRGSGGGSFVARPDPASLGEKLSALVALVSGGDQVAQGGAAGLTQARIHVQIGCAHLAAGLRSGIEDIRAEIDMQSDFAQPAPVFIASCLRMHLAICAASANPALTMLGQALVAAEFGRPGKTDYETRERARLLSYHVRIANGIAGGRAEDTRSALMDLLGFETERLDPGQADRPPPERPPRMRDLRLPRVQTLDRDGEDPRDGGAG